MLEAKPETILALVMLAWLIVSVLVLMRSVRRGRELAERFATRHPEEYEALGRPIPGILQSVRGNRFAIFVGRREYEALADAALVAEFEAYKRADARLIVSILTSGALLAAVGLLVRYAT